MCHLMVMSMDTEQFKHSCIVQPGRCGFHYNKSNVTAVGGDQELSPSQQVLWASWKVFPWCKRALIHLFFLIIWVLKIVSAPKKCAAPCTRLSRSTCLLIRMCHQCTHLVIHHGGACEPVRMRACKVLSKLTFTIFEDPLPPSLPERPLVSFNYPHHLQLPAHQVSASIRSSRRP